MVSVLLIEIMDLVEESHIAFFNEGCISVILTPRKLRACTSFLGFLGCRREAGRLALKAWLWPDLPQINSIPLAGRGALPAIALIALPVI
jgi:hypothetical protein